MRIAWDVDTILVNGCPQCEVKASICQPMRTAACCASLRGLIEAGLDGYRHFAEALSLKVRQNQRMAIADPGAFQKGLARDGRVLDGGEEAHAARPCRERQPAGTVVKAFLPIRLDPERLT